MARIKASNFKGEMKSSSQYFLFSVRGSTLSVRIGVKDISSTWLFTNQMESIVTSLLYIQVPDI